MPAARLIPVVLTTALAVLGPSPALAAGLPAYCQLPATELAGWRTQAGLNLLDEQVALKCSRRHPDCCRDHLRVTVTLNDPDKPASCVATLNYGLLVVDTAGGYSPKLQWRLVRSGAARRTDFIFDQQDGILVEPLSVPTPPVTVPLPLPVQQPKGYVHDLATRFTWASTGVFGAGNHHAVVHPNGDAQTTCEPKDPGIVNTH